MTKRWLSMLMVLTMLLTCFTGLASAETAGPKGSTDPVITFVPAKDEFDLTEALTTQQLLGTFYVDGTIANSDVSAKLRPLIDWVRIQWNNNSTTYTDYSGSNLTITNGKLYVPGLATAPSGSLTNGQCTGRIRMLFNSLTLTGYEIDVAADNWNAVNIAAVKCYHPITTLTLSTQTSDSPGVIVTNGTTSVVQGKQTDVLDVDAEVDAAAALEGDYTWTSSNTNVATVVASSTNDETATITTVGAGTATITATAKNNKGNKTATWTVIVAPVAVQNVTLTGSPLAIYDGSPKIDQQVQMKASASNSEATAACEVTWGTSDNNVATVTADGLVRFVGAGNVTITAYLKNDTSKKASKPFSVSGTATAGNPVFLIDNEEISSSVNLDAAKELVISNWVYDADNYYMISDSAISSTDIVADGIKYTGPIALDKNKTYYVKAQSTRGGAKSNVAETQIIVSIPVTEVKVTPATANVSGRGEVTLTAEVLPANADFSTITWESSSALAEVKPSTDGKSCVVKTTGDEGKVTITAKTDTSAIEGTCVITVTKQAVTSVSANPASITVAEGETVKLKGVVAPANASHQKFAYVSGDTSIATVSTAAETEDGVTVAGIAAGKSTTITLIHEDGKRAQCSVTVTEANTVTATPVFSEASGKVFPQAGSVELSCATTGATIYYTTDGSDPRYVAPSTYSGAIAVPVNTDVTIKAFARAAGKQDSPVAVASYSSVVAVTGITLDATAQLAGNGAKSTLTAVVAPSSPAPKDDTVIWTTSDESIVKVEANATNSKEAEITGGKPGKATITATTKDGSFKANCVVTVAEVLPSSVEITDVAGSTLSTLTVKADEWAQLKAKFNNYVSNQSVVWDSSDKTVATIDTNGKLVALKAGTTTVTVESVAKNSSNLTVRNTCAVTVTAASGIVNPPQITPTLSSQSDEITVEMTSSTVGASIYYTLDGTTPSATSTLYVEGGFKLHANAIVSAIAIKDGKSSTVAYANYTFNIPATKVTMDKTTATLTVDQTLQLTATMTPAYSTDKITWSSSSNAIATVKDGVVTAVSKGVATITARANASQAATCVVTVNDYEVTSVTIMPSSATMAIGDKLSLTASVKPVEIVDKSVVWTSSNKTVATVDGSTGVVKAEAAGTAVITATASNGVKGTATITVEADPSAIPTAPTILPSFDPTEKSFTAIENGSLSKVIGQFKPGTGETWEQIRYYYAVEFAFVGSTSFSGAISVDKDGYVTLNMSDVGKVDTSFSYKWTMSWKGRPGTPNTNIDGSTRTYSTNTLTITKKPSVIDATTPTIADQVLGQNGTVVMGTINNYAAFGETGTAIDLALTVTPAPKVTKDGFTADINSKGEIVLTVAGAAPGIYTVSVTISAKGCPTVTTKSVNITVTEPPVPVEPVVTVTAPSGTFKSTADVYAIRKDDGTATFSVPGVTGVTWKSSKPKYFKIDATTGVATFTKATTGIKVTATLPGGGKIVTKVATFKGAFANPAELKLQFKDGKSFVDSTPTGVTMKPSKSLMTRIYAAGGGKIVIQSVTIDRSIATRGTAAKAYVKTKKKSVSDGKSTTLIIKANGIEFSMPIFISAAAKDAIGEDFEIEAEVDEIVDMADIEAVEAE